MLAPSDNNDIVDCLMDSVINGRGASTYNSEYDNDGGGGVDDRLSVSGGVRYMGGRGLLNGTGKASKVSMVSKVSKVMQVSITGFRDSE